MIPVSTFNIMLSVMILLLLFSVIDYRNKLYANVISAVAASFVGIYLAAAMFMGIIEYSDGTVISDVSFAVIIVIITVIAMVYSYLLAYDAYEEHLKQADGESP